MIVLDSRLVGAVPGLQVVALQISLERVEDSSQELETLKSTVAGEIRSKYSLESIKDARVFRCYRDFFWRLGIDPTKVRPASEALARRILQGALIPTINTAVDAINLASVQTEMVINAFDSAKMIGRARIRFASTGENFLGIGMKHELIMVGGEIVISDDIGPIAIYPHRDAERTKVSLQTKKIFAVVCGVPGLERKELINGATVVSDALIRFCGGKDVTQVVMLP